MTRWTPILVVALFALGCALLLAGNQPVEYSSFEVPLFTSSLPSSDQTSEVRIARGAWTQSAPVGQNVSVRLNLDGEVVAEGVEPNADWLILDTLYASPSPQLEARLELHGVTVHPAGSIVQNLAPEEPAGFFWRLKAPQAGVFDGMLWIYAIHSTPEGLQNRQLVFARPVTLTAFDVLGLPPHQVRSAGWVSLALALAAAFPLGRLWLVRYWTSVRSESEEIG